MADYNLLLVGLSYCVSVLGSYVALKLASALPDAEGKMYWRWLGGAAFALGGAGIWSMHFLGMMAYQTPVEFGYDPVMTLVSLVLAVGVVGLGLFVVSKRSNQTMALVGAGTITGCGVAVMHYAGMEAMLMPGDMKYDLPIVIASVMIAVGASIVALWLAFNVTQLSWRIVSAMVMGVAVCGMHYTGMAALHMNYDFGGATGLEMLQYQSALDETLMSVLIGLYVVGFLAALWLGTWKSLSDHQARMEIQRVLD